MPPKRRWIWATMVALAMLTPSARCLAAEPPVRFTVDGELLRVQGEGESLEVSLRSPGFTLGTHPLSAAVAPAAVQGDLAQGETLTVRYPPVTLEDATLEVELRVAWSAEDSLLRKSVRVRLVEGQPDVLQEVVLDRIETNGQELWTHGSGKRKLFKLEAPQSHPVFLPGRFLGIEFPVASTRQEGTALLLAHRPGVRLEPGVWHDSHTALYGLTALGEEVRAFQQYIARHRPRPSGLHINYNSWWTSPVPYSEADIVRLMEELHAKFYQAQGVVFDSFCIDMGWSNPKTVWEIDARQFPSGFTKIRQTAEQMHARLGLWISPGSYYGQALDPQWAKQQGLETMPVTNGLSQEVMQVLCLGGEKYAGTFRQRLSELVRNFGIGQLKFDGLALVCPATDHGHEPGPGSSEAIAEGLIAAAAAARQANPEVWIEATCFGYNPSPWWLFHVNSVLGTFGDDAPSGRVPCPVYRESYTTARDYFNLQGAVLSPLPTVAQEVLGIIHQSPEPFLNDAVMTVLRGHRFVPVYVHPKFMDDARWRSLAELLAWARGHADVLEQSCPLLPVSWQSGAIPQFTDAGTMPREPYGYAHVKQNNGLIVLRNPWIARQEYRVVLDRSLGLSADAQAMDVRSIYPEPRRYAAGLKYGDVLDVPLAPYETVVLALGPQATESGEPPVATAIGRQLEILRSKYRLDRGSLESEASAPMQLALDARVQVAAPRAELLLLCEGEKPQTTPRGTILVNDETAATTEANSTQGWSATVLPTHEHWLFVRVPLPSGENRIALKQELGSECQRVSVWLWATKPGDSATSGSNLPQPELLSLDSAALVKPTELPAEGGVGGRIERLGPFH